MNEPIVFWCSGDPLRDLAPDVGGLAAVAAITRSGAARPLDVADTHSDHVSGHPAEPCGASFCPRAKGW